VPNECPPSAHHVLRIHTGVRPLFSTCPTGAGPHLRWIHGRRHHAPRGGRCVVPCRGHSPRRRAGQHWVWRHSTTRGLGVRRRGGLGRVAACRGDGRGRRRGHTLKGEGLAGLQRSPRHVGCMQTRVTNERHTSISTRCTVGCMQTMRVGYTGARETSGNTNDSSSRAASVEW
jgi:hypothetical protein